MYNSNDILLADGERIALSRTGPLQTVQFQDWCLAAGSDASPKSTVQSAQPTFERGFSLVPQNSESLRLTR